MKYHLESIVSGFVSDEKGTLLSKLFLLLKYLKQPIYGFIRLSEA